MNCGIYVITNVINGKRYVGSSINLKKRRYHHFYRLKLGTHGNPRLQNAYNKYGKDAFHFLVIEYCDPELLLERETYWMEYYDSRHRDKGYNLSSPDRREVSDETRAKMSASRKGRPGKPHSAESRAKISANNGVKGRPAHNRGEKHSDETRAKMSDAQKKWWDSEERRLEKSLNNPMRNPETRAKQSALKRGKPWSEARRAAQERRKA